MNTWYSTLNKPFLTPPPAYFPIAWTILYILMAISFGIILTKPKSKDKSLAISFFVLQLIFNLIWSFIFFEQKNILLALIDIIFIGIFLTITMIYFYKLSKIAFGLLIPYCLQIIFAIYLNFSILILN